MIAATHHRGLSIGPMRAAANVAGKMAPMYPITAAKSNTVPTRNTEPVEWASARSRVIRAV